MPRRRNAAFVFLNLAEHEIEPRPARLARSDIRRASGGKAVRLSLWHLKAAGQNYYKYMSLFAFGRTLIGGCWVKTWNRFERRGVEKIVKQICRCGVCL
jgi:hypothetical protein